MKRISILDYGAGNIFSIKNAVEKCGYKAILTSDFDQILKSTHLIFPGVGSFDNCMQKLKDKISLRVSEVMPIKNDLYINLRKQ